MTRVRFHRGMQHRQDQRRYLQNAFAALVLLLPLSGCNILPKQQSLTLYAPQPQIAADAAWPRVQWQLQIPRPYADAMHDASRILVRPQRGELQVYKGATWAQSAPDLIQDTLLRAFIDSGRIDSVARRGEGIGADYELLLDLRRFESDYTDSGAPQVKIELGGRLVDNASNRVIATHVFNAETPVEGVDVAQINHAFERGLGDVAQQIIGWTLTEGQQETQRKR